MITLILIFFLLIISAASNAAMDILDFKFNSSIFSEVSEKWYNWFNPEESWKNKYKNRDPQQGPAFFGSTTFLVWTTDAWHFFKMIMLSCLTASITIGIGYIAFANYPILKLIFADAIVYFIIRFLYGFIFETFWTKIFVKK